MALQHRLLFLPPGAERISEHLAAAHHDGRLTFFDASGPIFSCREEDEGALRFAAAMLTEPGLGLAGPSQIARAVRRHRSQVHEYRTRYREGGAQEAWPQDEEGAQPIPYRLEGTEAPHPVRRRTPPSRGPLLYCPECGRDHFVWDESTPPRQSLANPKPPYLRLVR